VATWRRRCCLLLGRRSTNLSRQLQSETTIAEEEGGRQEVGGSDAREWLVRWCELFIMRPSELGRLARAQLPPPPPMLDNCNRARAALAAPAPGNPNLHLAFGRLKLDCSRRRRLRSGGKLAPLPLKLAAARQARTVFNAASSERNWKRKRCGRSRNQIPRLMVQFFPLARPAELRRPLAGLSHWRGCAQFAAEGGGG